MKRANVSFTWGVCIAFSLLLQCEALWAQGARNTEQPKKVEVAKDVITLLLEGSGVLVLILTAYQLAVRRRAHVLELYRQSFAVMDEQSVRDARHFVYKVGRDAYRDEHWLKIDAYKADPEYPNWLQNLARAEKVARSFDQLGLLVREGLLPLNIVARFYASPALRCWYRLSPYINADRSDEGRDQPGHMWEWENLVLRVIIPQVRRGKGTWKGVSKHDRLEGLSQKIEHDHQTMIKDADYSPRTTLWELPQWYQFWRW